MSQNQFQSILSQFRKYAYSERDKGDKFERLIQAYLQTDPRYADLFTSVWLWNDFPARRDFGGKDTGIDLVARTSSGDYWAIQCKCYFRTRQVFKLGRPQKTGHPVTLTLKDGTRSGHLVCSPKKPRRKYDEDFKGEALRMLYRWPFGSGSSAGAGYCLM